MSPESRAERGAGGLGAPANSEQDDAPKEDLRKWDRFSEERTNDPRCMAFAGAMDRGLSIGAVPLPEMNLTLNRQQQKALDAGKRILEISEPWGEEWDERMDELQLSLHTLVETYILYSQVIGFPKPTEGAMTSATEVLQTFDPEFQFPFDSDPECHRYLQPMDETHRLLRSLLANRYIRILLPWIPEREDGELDTRRLDTTAAVVENLGMMIISLGPYGLVLFKGVSDMRSKIVVFVATAVGVFAMLMTEKSRKNVLVLGLMAVMASIVF